MVYCLEEQWKVKYKERKQKIDFIIAKVKDEQANLYSENPYQIQANNFTLNSRQNYNRTILKYKPLLKLIFMVDIITKIRSIYVRVKCTNFFFKITRKSKNY
jgi:hypothetical protein